MESGGRARRGGGRADMVVRTRLSRLLPWHTNPLCTGHDVCCKCRPPRLPYLCPASRPQVRIMDSNDLERERGITILSKVGPGGLEGRAMHAQRRMPWSCPEPEAPLHNRAVWRSSCCG